MAEGPHLVKRLEIGYDPILELESGGFGCHMSEKRDSIISLGKSLVKLVIEDGGNSAKAHEIATRLDKLLRTSGTYTKRYKSHEERVLHRHLNLYLNKRAKAQTAVEKQRWDAKVIDQRAKIEAFEAGVEFDATADDLDLDGL